MTTSLHDRLAELADDAPPGGPVPELWDRATRFHRARRAGTVAILAVAAALLVAVGLLVHVRSTTDVLPASGTAGVPDRLYAPSRWLPGSTEEGPLGQLAAILPAVRGGWFGSSDGIVGVSASNGEYRFLDLRDRGDHDSSLAPDGRHIAYWTTGTPSGTPNTADGQSEPVTGVAVYDTTTGEVTRHEFASVHGLAADQLAWSDADTLLVYFGQNVAGDDGPDMERGMSNDYAWFRWSLADHAPAPLAGVPDGSRLLSTGGGWAAFDHGGNGVLLVDPDDPARTESFRLDREFMSAPVPNSTGRRLAGIPGNQTPHPVGLVEVSDGRATTTTVPGSKRTFEALTWLDDDRVVVQRARDRSREVQLVSVLDVEDGSLADLVTIPYDAQNASFATDLLALPVGPAVRPPRPVDPRMKAVAIVAIIAAAGAAAALWRRRVRA